MFVVTIGCQEQVTVLLGCCCPGKVKPSSGCAGAKGCISAAGTCCVATAEPFLALVTSVPAQSSGAKVGYMMLEMTWPLLC